MSADAAHTDSAHRTDKFWTGWGSLLGGAAYGLLLVLAFPPVGLWPLAFLLVLPLALVASRAGARPIRAGALAALGSLPAWLFEHLWLIDVTVPGFPMLALLLAAYTGLFVAIVAVASRRLGEAVPVAVVIPIVWTGVEFLRGEVVLTGYPWYLAAHPLIEAPALAAPAAWLGTYFVSSLVAALAGAAIAIFRGTAHSRRLALGMLAVVAVVWIAAAVAGGNGPAATDASATIAVVQTNLAQSNKISWSVEERLRDWERFAELTRLAAAAVPGGKPDLIAWPESMFPGDALNPEALRTQARAGLYWPAAGPGGEPIYTTHFAERLLDLQESIGVPMLVGATAMDGLTIRQGAGGRVETDFRARYNSAFLLTHGSIREQRYDKMHLTPFGEVIPYVWRWPSLQQAFLDLGASGMAFNLTAGRSPTVFTLDIGGGRTLRFAAPICFEAAMPAVSRRLAYQDGALVVDVLINLSNDGWFGRFRAGREQHLQVSRWRAVELGVPVIRSVNTGISAWIDAGGRLVAAGPDGGGEAVNVDGVLVAKVPIGRSGKGTLYGRTGEWFGWLALAGMGLLLAASLAAGRRRKTAGSGAGDERGDARRATNGAIGGAAG